MKRAQTPGSVDDGFCVKIGACCVVVLITIIVVSMFGLWRFSNDQILIEATEKNDFIITEHVKAIKLAIAEKIKAAHQAEVEKIDEIFKLSSNNNESGRKPGDLKYIGIILKSSSYADTSRWIDDVQRQRKSPKDLPIFIYSEFEFSFDFLESIKQKKSFINVDIINSTNHTAVKNRVLLSRINYTIAVEDSEFMGEDFGDFYFFGARVLAADREISSVCGGVSEQREEFFAPEKGDVFWISDVGCDIGPMKHRVYLYNDSTSDLISLYPEVARIGEKKEFVTNSTWNLEKMDAKLWSSVEIEKRMMKDIKSASPILLNDLKNVTNLDKSNTFFYTYKNINELVDVFDEDQLDILMNSRKFKNIIPFFYEGRKIYLSEEAN